TANIGALQSNNINVTDNFSVGNDASFGNGLVVGSGGILSYGGLSISNPSSTSYFAGSIGIGTNSPSASLHITNGDILQTVGIDPVELGSNEISSSGVSSIHISGKYAYVSTSGGAGDDFFVIDTSDPNNPTTVGSLDVGGIASFSVSGNYAYAGLFLYNDNFLVIDISNPASPTTTGIFDLMDGVGGIYISGNYAYVGTYGDFEDNLKILDISNPTSPALVGSLDLIGSVGSVYVSGNYAYVGTDVYGDDFQVVDISDPTNPILMGGLNLSDNAKSVYVSGNYAYVGTEGSGDDFYIVDISDPNNPTTTASLDFIYGVNNIHISGNYAYVALGSPDSQFKILDISDHTSPVVVGNLSLSDGAASVDVSGKYAYVGTYGAGDDFHVVDLVGIDVPTANIGNIKSDNVNIVNNLTVGNDVYVNNGLMVDGNSLFSGAMSISGGLVLTDATSSVSTTVDFAFNSASTTEWTMRLDKSDNRLYIVDNTGGNGVYIGQTDTAWTGNSDERLKENIMSLDVLDRIDNYRAVSFDWKANGKHDIGAIAQELYNIFPEAVSVGKDELGPNGQGAWGIQYSKLGALALEGVKELKQQLDTYNALLLSGNLDDFISQTNQNNTLTFAQDVFFTKHVAFGQDNIGSALIQAGENGVRVEFAQEFATPPIVNLTLASDVTLDTYFVDSVDTTGFTIKIRPIQSQDIVINWYAFEQVSDSATSISETSSSESISDNLTDLANNYLQDNGLTLDNVSSTDEVVTSTENINSDEVSSSTIDITTTTDITN
ncbi:MAG: tail fiber domain-containing protein, partial [Candidatus Magasanikbacteria bacterium]